MISLSTQNSSVTNWSRIMTLSRFTEVQSEKKLTFTAAISHWRKLSDPWMLRLLSTLILMSFLSFLASRDQWPMFCMKLMIQMKHQKSKRKLMMKRKKCSGKSGLYKNLKHPEKTKSPKDLSGNLQILSNLILLKRKKKQFDKRESRKWLRKRNKRKPNNSKRNLEPIQSQRTSTLRG